MYKSIYKRPLLFKTLVIAVFGVFFYVQAQSEFIYCAYNDLPTNQPCVDLLVPGAGTHVNKGQAANDLHSNLKLNKRYQAVTQYAILPLAVSAPIHFTVVYTQWHTAVVPSHVYFLYTKPLRGPPAV